MQSALLIRDQALSLWSGSTDSNTLDYQRTNPKEYQIVRTHTKEASGIQDPASPNHQQHPVQDASSKQQTKQKIQTKSSADKITISLNLAHQRKSKQRKKQTKTQHKFHLIGSLHKPLDQPQEGRNQKEERIQP